MPETPKPRCRLTGTNGNVFALAGRVRRTLLKARQPEQAAEMVERLKTCASSEAALRVFMEDVDVT
jgi:hypothetical protein